MYQEQQLKTVINTKAAELYPSGVGVDGAVFGIAAPNGKTLQDAAEVGAIVYWDVYTAEVAEIIIGRLKDTEQYLTRSKKYLQDSQAPAQSLKGVWSTCVNDCWILGGMHRARTFRLVSEPAEATNGSADYPLTVSVREITGLEAAGYTRKPDVNSTLFVPPSDTARLISMTLEDYVASVTKHGAMAKTKFSLS